MDNDDASIQVFGLTEVFQVVTRRWRWVVGAIVVIVALALVLSLQQEKRYEATSTVLLATATQSDLGVLDSNVQLPALLDRNLVNQLQLLGSIDMQRAVEEAYEGDLDVSDVTASTAEVGSDAVNITVGGNDPEGVADLANVYARTYIEYTQRVRIENLTNFGARLQQLQTELQQRRSDLLEPLDALDARIASGEGGLSGQRADLAADLSPQLTALDTTAASYTGQQEALRLAQNVIATGAPQLIQEASPPKSPESPKPVRDAVIGFMVGVILGLVLAFARDFLDETIRTTDDLDRILAGKYPVLGVIPDAEQAEARALPDATTHTPAAEAYRALRTSVRFAELDRPMKVIQVTSASPGEGKTTTVANLAAVLTQAGHRVAVAGCDLRRPAIQGWFGAPVSPGMSDVVLGRADARRCHPGGRQPPLPPGGRHGTDEPLRAARQLAGRAGDLRAGGRDGLRAPRHHPRPPGDRLHRGVAGRRTPRSSWSAPGARPATSSSGRSPPSSRRRHR